ncbi:MAG: MFS transporter [Sphingomonadales bacterium]|nr:MFS transporter [Sphingomonadales bacterium]
MTTTRPANHARPGNHRAIFWISVLALFTAAVANAIRGGASEAMKAELFDPVDAVHSGELIASVLGNAFLGFALSLLAISPLLDRIGAKRIVLFASACFIVGPALILIAPAAGGFGAVYAVLNAGMIATGFGWGATEGSINAITTTMYAEDKTGKLNVLHAWWPAGMIVGGLLCVLLFGAGLGWRTLIALVMVPGAALGLWALRHEFPQTESTVAGVSFCDMLAEPFRHAGFWVFPAIMFLTASTELAPGAWVQVALTETVGMQGVLLNVYVAAIMFAMRHFAGPLEHKFSDMGLLWMSTVPAGIGLYLLATANSPVTALAAATLWAFGVCFMWPTMLAAIARRYPRSGSWGIGIVNFSGALAITIVLPQIGKIYDNAKIAKAGGQEAFAALQAGSPAMHAVLAHAAEVSFKAVATIPVALFVIFGLVRLIESKRNDVT